MPNTGAWPLRIGASNYFAERYPAAENNPDECIIRADDARIDIFFESKETEEIYLLQCKHPKIAQSDLIPEDEVKPNFLPVS